MHFEAALFGSVARGMEDAFSDLDVICVLDEVEDADLDGLREKLGRAFNSKPSISFYSQRRIAKLYQLGSPFAWHLFYEAQRIDGFSWDYVPSLGRPAQYSDAEGDIESLIEIMRSINKRIDEPVASMCYEGGLIYVCLRNIGIFASFRLASFPKFDRFAPYGLSHDWRLPVSIDAYNVLVACRHASARGKAPPILRRGWLRDQFQIAFDWSLKVGKEISNGK